MTSSSFIAELSLLLYLLPGLCLAWGVDKDYYKEEYDDTQDCPKSSRVGSMDT